MYDDDDYSENERFLHCEDPSECGEHGGPCSGHWVGYALPA